jgi:hypothetical protein
MRRVFILYLLSILSASAIHGNTRCQSSSSLISTEFVQDDSLQRLQLLYRGVIWTNKYRRFTGDQFFRSTLFLPGTVSVNGHTFKNVRLKYDIYSDEIITPLNMEEIIQLNKEMVDSFTLTENNKVYRFINFQNDSASLLKGYCNLLYSGKTVLYVKHVKSISTAVTIQSDGEFNESSRIFVKSGEVIYPVKSTKDLISIMNDHRDEIMKYISDNKIKVTRNDPGSFIPVIRFYDNINQKN